MLVFAIFALCMNDFYDDISELAILTIFIIIYHFSKNDIYIKYAALKRSVTALMVLEFSLYFRVS